MVRGINNAVETSHQEHCINTLSACCGYKSKLPSLLHVDSKKTNEGQYVLHCLKPCAFIIKF